MKRYAAMGFSRLSRLQEGGTGLVSQGYKAVKAIEGYAGMSFSRLLGLLEGDTHICFSKLKRLSKLL